MNRRSVQVLAAIIVGLLLLLLVLQKNGDSGSVAERALLPALKEHANNVTGLSIQAAETVSIARVDGRWVVSSRDRYPADIGKLRQLLIALSEANIVAAKTANPEQYAKLGVDDPASGGAGTRVTVSGPDFSYAVILGNTAQGNFRYARVADAETSYLIDQDPALPASADDWLLTEILDIGASRLQKVSIAHAAGETIVISKDSQEQTDFVAQDIPPGRELSYPAVANGIAGALGQLTLDDVRAAIAAPPATTVEFLGWDGFTITAAVVSEDDTSWVSFSAAMTGDESSAADEVAAINRRLAGWQYQLPEHKKNLLTRHWDDILKAAE